MEDAAAAQGDDGKQYRRRFKNAEAGKKLFDRVTNRYAELRGVRDDYDRYLKAYEFGTEPDRGDKEQVHGLHLLAAAVDGQLAYMAYRDGKFYSRPMSSSEDAAQQAREAAAILDKSWGKSRSWVEARRSAKDSFIFGTGYVRTNYDQAGLSMKADDYEVADDVSPEMTVGDEQVMEGLAEMELVNVVDSNESHVYIERISPYNVVTPGGFIDLRKMPWVAIRHVRLLDAVKADPDLKVPPRIRANESIDEAHVESSKTSQRRAMPTSEEPEHIVVWEVWYQEYTTALVTVGKKKQRRRIRETRCVMMTDAPVDDSTTSDHPHILAHNVSYLDMPGYPLVSMRFIEVPDRHLGASLVARMLGPAEDMQRIFDMAVEGLLAAFSEKVIINEGKFSTTARNKLAAPGRSLVRAKGQGNPGNYIHKIAAQAFPQETAMAMNMVESMFSQVGAGDEALRGGRSSSGSATEFAGRTSILQVKSGDFQQAFEAFISEAGEKTWALAKQFYTSLRTVETVDPETGMPSFTRAKPAEMRDEFDIRLFSNSTKAESPEMEQQALMGFTSAVVELLTALQQLQVPPEVVELFLNRFMRAWEMDGAETKNAFAAITAGAIRAGAQAAGAAPGGAPIESGAASNPETGAPLTAPNPLPQQAAAMAQKPVV